MLSDIIEIIRYNDRYEIYSNAGLYRVWLKNSKEFDALMARYKKT